jgi:hypothetical protein
MELGLAPGGRGGGGGGGKYRSSLEALKYLIWKWGVSEFKDELNKQIE